MGEKVTFYPITKIIQIDETPVSGVVEIDVKIDLYSDGKEDWVSTPSLTMIPFPIRSVGGDPLPGDKALGATFFLDNAWKIRPYEGDHRLLINGNLYSEDGSSPLVPTLGSYNVMVEYAVSSLVDSTVQQLPEIQRMAFGDGVTIDVVNGEAGTDYDIGTQGNPSDNLADAKIIAIREGFNRIFILGDYTFGATDVIDNLKIIGQGHGFSTLTFTDGCSAINTELRDADLEGTLDGGDQLFYYCNIYTLINFSGIMYYCGFHDKLTLNGNDTVHLIYCYSAVAGSGTPEVDMGGSGRNLGVRGYIGGLLISNLTADQNVSLDFLAGQLKIASSVTAGLITYRGNVKLTENLGTPTELNDYGAVSGDLIRMVQSLTSLELNPATEEDLVRKVGIGKLDNVILKVRRMLDTNWDNPVVQDTLYQWYENLNDDNPIKSGEDG